jgi:glutaredoxin-related protein
MTAIIVLAVLMPAAYAIVAYDFANSDSDNRGFDDPNNGGTTFVVTNEIVVTKIGIYLTNATIVADEDVTIQLYSITNWSLLPGSFLQGDLLGTVTFTDSDAYDRTVIASNCSGGADITLYEYVDAMDIGTTNLGPGVYAICSYFNPSVYEFLHKGTPIFNSGGGAIGHQSTWYFSSSPATPGTLPQNDNGGDSHGSYTNFMQNSETFYYVLPDPGTVLTIR